MKTMNNEATKMINLQFHFMMSDLLFTIKYQCIVIVFTFNSVNYDRWLCLV